MRGSFWETIKDTILYKEFNEWRNNQAIFRAFLQKEAVKKKIGCCTQTTNILSIFLGKKKKAKPRRPMTNF
jgi:hypothetical protein